MKTNYLLRQSGQPTITLKDNGGRVAMHDLIKYILSSAVHCPSCLKGLTVYKQEVDENGEEKWCEPFLTFSSPEVLGFLKNLKEWDKTEMPQVIASDNKYPPKI